MARPSPLLKRSGSDAAVRPAAANASAIHNLLATAAQAALLRNLGQQPPAAAAFEIVAPRHLDRVALPRRHLGDDIDFLELFGFEAGQVHLDLRKQDPRLVARADHLL